MEQAGREGKVIWGMESRKSAFTTLYYNSNFNNMKRGPSNDISEFEEKSRKLVKPDTNGHDKNGASEAERGELTKFIKDPKVVEVLKQKGIERFFPVQYETYQDIYDGCDLIARDRTGSGKTIAFSLPIIQRFR